MSEKYKPTPEEMKIVDNYMADGSEMAEQSAEREKEQREFEERTKSGFEKFKALIEESNSDPQKKQEFRNLLAQALYLNNTWVETYPEVNEVILLMCGLFDRIEEMDELADRKRKFEKEVTFAQILKDLKLRSLEVAGKHGGLGGFLPVFEDPAHTWPLRNTWYMLGMRDFYLSDIDVEKDSHYHKENGNDLYDVHKIKLDALNPGNAISGKQFDFVYSAGFFGQPTVDIAKERRESQEDVEQTVINNLKDSVRPGGFFAFGTREEFAVDPDWLEGQGFDVATCRLFNDYLIARKKGTFEVEEDQSQGNSHS